MADENLKIIEPTWFRNVRGIFTGTLAGISITLVGHPFDTLKVRLQVQSDGNKVYSGLSDCFLKTIKWEGFQGLYKGMSSPLAGQVFFRTLKFSSFYETLEFFSNKENKPNTQLQTYQYYIAGGVAGGFSSLADGPMDLFKSKLQIQIIREKMGLPLECKYNSVYDCCKKIFQKYGIRGVYQGYSPTFIRNSLGYSIYFGTNEILKRKMLNGDETIENIEYSKIIVSGALCGILFWTSIFNLDVIKSAMMADDIDPKKRNYKGIFDCAKKLYINEGGYKRLWKGYLPCLLRSAPANGLMLYMVDLSRNLFPKYERFT